MISGERIRFPARWCRYYPGDYEPEVFDFVRAHCRTGETVIDAGAHMGVLSVVMARLVGESGRVFSFEPTLSARVVLEKTVRLNRCEGIVEIRPEALGRVTGSAMFYDDTSVPAPVWNSLVPFERSDRAIHVKTVSIDDFVSALAAPPASIKVDVEGAELNVLRGAVRTLDAHRPAIHVGVHPVPLRRDGGTLEALWDLASEHGYDIRIGGRSVTRKSFVDQQGLFSVELIPK
jgi:FkbM family methyltransferase